MDILDLAFPLSLGWGLAQLIGSAGHHVGFLLMAEERSLVLLSVCVANRTPTIFVNHHLLKLPFLSSHPSIRTGVAEKPMAMGGVHPTCLETLPPKPSSLDFLTVSHCLKNSRGLIILRRYLPAPFSFVS